ncbi:iron complex outermembrane receptor protein [Sphingobium sp. B2D3A]|uniref:TonB-dependent receptor n=1 Tax=unclassified Sphingobium TaxID=2611147 RepID=UPI0022254C68|nr:MULTISPECIES: TonB-dependent receptor [unclassified Sphingobium]MCW2338471.1 iron complex outermembrane receptor protein [Sphingobium sp. B2D3A]MCW2384929.1 iron complex outermembrane receptor protein [Sphingobium sp. B2D3D]
MKRISLSIQASIPALLLASTSALAQTPQAAQTATAADDGMEIIVTAQKREQSLQDVGAAVSALGADRIASAGVNSISDLQTIVPSVNFGSDFNQAKIFIRGVGANTSTTGSSTGVAFHVDGAYVARAEAQLTSLFDLERIEVLRGPQGTLYGRNAVGGSINVITARPTDIFSGYGRIGYGNYNALTTEAAISGPITEGIRARLAIKTENRDGYGVNPVSGKDVDDLNRRMGRASLEFDLGREATLLVSGEYFRQSDASGAIHYLRASFPGVARLAPLGVGGYATNPRDLATESSPGTETETYAFTGTLNVPLNDALTLTNIANYRSFKSSLFQDLDLSAVIDSLPTNGQATTVQERRIDSKQWSNELRLGLQSEWVNGTIGVFFFHERQRPIDNVGLANRTGMAQNIGVLQAAGIDLNEAYGLCGYSPNGVTGGSNIIAPKRVCTRSNLLTEAFSIFGQYEIGLGMFSEALSGLSVKLGGRWSSEHVESENPSIIITRNGVGPVLRYTAAGTHVEKTFRDFTPEAGLVWKANQDILLYYTYSEGFKAGSGENAAGSTTIVNPEKMFNHEAGIKASFGRMLTVNLAGYAYTLNGLQLNKTIAGGPTGYTTIFQNAAKTRAKGIELDAMLRPMPGLRLSGALSYTDAHFVDYLTLDPLNPANIAGGTPYNAVTNPDPTAFGAPSGGNIQLAGNDTRNSPRWSWNLHGEYDVIAPIGTFTPSVDVSYKSRTYFSEYMREIESSAAYTMVDASLAYETNDGRIRAQLWAKNLFDVFRPSSTFALATGRLLGVTWLPPRTYGLTVGYKF